MAAEKPLCCCKCGITLADLMVEDGDKWWCIDCLRAELDALRAKLAAWEACAEPFEITDPAEFQKEIKRLMDDPMDWMLSLDKAMRERDALRAQVSAVEKENAELHRELQAARDALKAVLPKLEGYETGEYGEQGDFYPYPVTESVAIIKAALAEREAP